MIALLGEGKFFQLFGVTSLQFGSADTYVDFFFFGKQKSLAYRKYPPLPSKSLKQFLEPRVPSVIYLPKVPQKSSDGPDPCYAGHCTALA